MRNSTVASLAFFWASLCFADFFIDVSRDNKGNIYALMRSDVGKFSINGFRANGSGNNDFYGGGKTILFSDKWSEVHPKGVFSDIEGHTYVYGYNNDRDGNITGWIKRFEAEGAPWDMEVTTYFRPSLNDAKGMQFLVPMGMVQNGQPILVLGLLDGHKNVINLGLATYEPSQELKVTYLHSPGNLHHKKSPSHYPFHHDDKLALDAEIQGNDVRLWLATREQGEVRIIELALDGSIKSARLLKSDHINKDCQVFLSSAGSEAWVIQKTLKGSHRVEIFKYWQSKNEFELTNHGAIKGANGLFPTRNPGTFASKALLVIGATSNRETNISILDKDAEHLGKISEQTFSLRPVGTLSLCQRGFLKFKSLFNRNAPTKGRTSIKFRSL